MSFTHSTGTILAKELRTEFRSRELLGTTIVFVLIVIVLFSFTFDPTSSESQRFGPGLLWLAFLFAASLMLQPSFLREQTNDTLSSLRLVDSDPPPAGVCCPLQRSAPRRLSASYPGDAPGKFGGFYHGNRFIRDFCPG